MAWDGVRGAGVTSRPPGVAAAGTVPATTGRRRTAVGLDRNVFMPTRRSRNTARAAAVVVVVGVRETTATVTVAVVRDRAGA